MINLFLSAVTQDFGSYRQRLAQDLEVKSVLVIDYQEVCRHTGTDTLLKLYDHIALSNAVLHIVGDRIGSFPKRDEVPELLRHDERLQALTVKLRLDGTLTQTITRTYWEFLIAHALGKRLFVAVPGSAVSRDTLADSLIENQEQQQQLDAILKARGMDSSTPNVYDSLVRSLADDHRARCVTLLGKEKIEFGSYSDLAFSLTRALIQVQQVEYLRAMRAQHRTVAAIENPASSGEMPGERDATPISNYPEVQQKMRAAFFKVYREDRIKEWSKPQYGANDTLFTQLSVLVDKGEDEAEQYQAKKQVYPTLTEAITDNDKESKVFVLLGSPGSGKSTLLRHLDLQTAREAGSEANAPFSYFVSLKQYRAKKDQSPLEWLRAKWESDWRKGNEHIQEIDDLLSQPGSYLFLDALNEMPRGSKSYNELVDEWTGFLSEVDGLKWQCWIVFSCRSLLYSHRLSTPEIRVPHIDIRALDPPTIHKFLTHYARDRADTLFQRIKDADQFGLYGTAYFLKMLIEVAGPDSAIPGDRAELITAYVRKLLGREFLKETRLIRNAGPLAAEDIDRLGRLLTRPDGWRGYELLERGPLFQSIGNLAFAMQKLPREGAEGEERYQLIVDEEIALNKLEPASGSTAGDLLEAACELSILEHDKAGRKVQFVHQLIQEYFAGRCLVRTPDHDLVRTDWRVASVKSKTPQDISEPLPPADSTGWDESMLFAALMAEDPEQFIAGLTDPNLAVAGRCAAEVLASEEADTRRKVRLRPKKLPTAMVTNLRDRLRKRMTDSEAEFRVRIAMGKALGELGSSALAKAASHHGVIYLTPPVVPVALGTRVIGRDNPPHTFEGPEHEVTVKPFEIARFPVTNAEWACFMRDGGYHEPGWWKTKAAEDWRRGDSTYVCRTVQWYAFRQMLQKSKLNDPPDEDYLSRKLKSKELSPKEALNHEKALKKSDEEFAMDMRTDFAGGPLTEPRRWCDRNFNNPLQPVVGICWYEAIAYCEWLSDRSRRRWRLPTEAEWETAARMRAPTNAEYPWGSKFTTDRCNTFESHIRATTPVGLYLDQAAADDRELADVSGNAYEWTLSRYDKKHFKYPYRADDGREEMEDNLQRTDPVADEMVEHMRADVSERAKSEGWTAAKVEQVLAAARFYPRVLRGGSFYYSKDEARVTFRLRFHPGYHNQSTGFRLVREV